jgi:cbb3-type cytochrome oxidase maturation protein
MESLYLLVPLSALVVLAVLAVFGWAVHAGQFDGLDGEAQRILDDGEPQRASLDADQGSRRHGSEE